MARLPRTLDSGQASLRMGVADPLIDADADGRLVPVLAADWSALEDGLPRCFTPPDGVAFHDGAPKTAETVVNALDIARAEPGPLTGVAGAGPSADDGAAIISLAGPRGAHPAFVPEFCVRISCPPSRARTGRASPCSAPVPPPE